MKCPMCPDNPVFTIKNEHEWKEQNGIVRCSGCGSLTPEEFLRRAEAGETVIPTDKNYKVYVGSDNHKFYFEHMNIDQMKQFIKLMNENKLKMAYPGYFYVTPYFCVVQGRN